MHLNPEIFPHSLKMTSREIADLVESRHDDVKRSIERLAERGVLTLPPMAEVANPGAGPKLIAVYELCKRDSYIVVAQLSPEFTARLVDRWQELEAGTAVPQNLPEALRLAADLAEQKLIAEGQRDEAVRTKAWIGTKREATAMATAAAAVRKAERLQEELGRNQKHATILAVERATGNEFARNAFVALRSACKSFGLQPVDVVDPRYGTVKAWPALAWREAFDIDLAELFGQHAETI